MSDVYKQDEQAQSTDDIAVDDMATVTETSGDETSGDETSGDAQVDTHSSGQAEKSSSSTRSVALWRLAIVAVLLIFVWFLMRGLQRQTISEQRADGTAPQFEFTTFEGETVRLADFEGKGVVLNFWASWCEPCRAEADLLEATWRREKDQGIVFIGLDYLDQVHAAEKYLEEFDVTYPNGADLQSQWARRYGIKGVPETFFITPDGKIAEIVVGPVLGQAQLDGLIDQIRPE
ncbi:MAG: TlpA disulfide reductase family protein [Chloroflexota bacterium]